jgi:hypothetical protein
MGFELLDVVEPKPAEEMLERYPRFQDDYRMSHFIVFKARKGLLALTEERDESKEEL